MEAYIPLVGTDNRIPDGITKMNLMTQILHWIRFRTKQQHESLCEDAFELYSNIQALIEKDISTMANDFSG